MDVDSTDWGLFAKRVRQMDNEVGKALRKNITRIAKPIALEVKAKALSLPSGGGEASNYRKKKGVEAGAGLRQGIAASIETKVQPTQVGNFSIRIRASGTKFQKATGKPVTLPRYMEGLSRKPWRHRVYGGDVWVLQQSHPYLLSTVIPHKPEVVAAVRHALEEAARAVGFH